MEVIFQVFEFLSTTNSTGYLFKKALLDKNTNVTLGNVYFFKLL